MLIALVLGLCAWEWAHGRDRGAGTRNADYWAWGKTVLAPASGRVVEAVDGVRDNRPQVEAENRAEPAGNHRVRPGDALGLTGNSGNSSEPHLHFHVQDRPGLFGAARGLPVSFVGYRADGRRIARGTPLQGQFIQRS